MSGKGDIMKCLTAGRKLPKSARAILLSAEGPASEYWPVVKPGEPDLGLCRRDKDVLRVREKTLRNEDGHP